jgi:DNA ligase D-like protein (predicted ligase)
MPVATDPFAGLTDDERSLLEDAPPPQHAQAMKAVLTDARFSDPGWIFERKLDGIRCIAIRDGGATRLLSRNDLSMNARYPEIAAALDGQSTRFAIDGEVVAFDGAQTSFAKLGERRRRPIPIFLYAFDITWLDGKDTRALPLHARKRLLRSAFDFTDPLRFSQHRNGESGRRFFEEACRKGWEGLIAKRAESPYLTSRSKDWLKLKCEQGQEMVIGGYTPPKGSRTEFGALLLGHYSGDDLLYAGKVGTGFDRAMLEELGGKLRALKRDTPPFADAGAIKERGVSWVEPRLVAQVGFTEWTRDGRLRHPRFLGLRDDKPARKVVREA